MLKHLRDQAKATQAISIAAGEGPLRPPPPSRSGRWRFWAVVAGLVFGAYVFLGPIVLKPEFQWKVLYAKATGAGEAEFIRQTTQAMAQQAGAVEAAKVPPQLEIEKIKREYEANLQEIIKGYEAQLHAQKAAIDLWRAAREANIQADQVAQTKAAEAYQNCVERARQEAAQARSSAGGPDSTLAGIQAAGALAYMRASEICAPLEAQQDLARRAAGEAATSNYQNNTER